MAPYGFHMDPRGPRKDPYGISYRVRSVICEARQAQTAEDPRCVLRTAHDDESIVRPFAFHRERSEAFDGQFTGFSHKNYRAAQ